MKRKVLGFHNLRYDVALRLAVDALRNWSGAPMSHADLDQGRWVTDTKQITRDLKTQRLTVDTPTLQALAGRLNSAPSATSTVRLTTSTTFGTLTAESLDGKPLAESASLLVKMTSVARNDMVKIAPALSGPKPQRLTSLGVAPIRTDGRATTIPTRVEIGGKLLIEVFLQNGTWEYLTGPEGALLFLDTGAIAVNLPERPKLIRWHTGKDVITYTPESTRLTIPGGVRLTEIVWER